MDIIRTVNADRRYYLDEDKIYMQTPWSIRSGDLMT